MRPIAPDDRQRLVAAFERLSPESRYRRFFTNVGSLSDRDLDYLTDVDHHHHEALLALDEGGREGIGVARFIRTDEAQAELAVTVADDWQGRGVGSLLLDALTDRARDEGIRRFTATVLTDNDHARALISRLGATRRTFQAGETLLEIDLPDKPGAGEKLMDLLRAMGAGTVSSARSLVRRTSSLPDVLIDPRREPVAAPLNVIVVGADGTAASAATLRCAAGLAASAGARLVIACAHADESPADRRPAEGAIDAVARPLREQGLDVDVDIRAGAPAPVVLDAAIDSSARLIVVGAGRDGLARRLLGTVADSVANAAICDVLIVRD